MLKQECCIVTYFPFHFRLKLYILRNFAVELAGIMPVTPKYEMRIFMSFVSWLRTWIVRLVFPLINMSVSQIQVKVFFLQPGAMLHFAWLYYYGCAYRFPMSLQMMTLIQIICRIASAWVGVARSRTFWESVSRWRLTVTVITCWMVWTVHLVRMGCWMPAWCRLSVLALWFGRCLWKSRMVSIRSAPFVALSWSWWVARRRQCWITTSRNTQTSTKRHLQTVCDL